jgi:hypothetical protein
MRIGNNPSKDQPVPDQDYFHQVIIPVYIPNLEDYYEGSHKVLDLCLNSLFKTSHSLTFITIVNNGSCEQVKEYLENLFNNGQIHELIHTSNIGKLNAIIKGLGGHRFSMITIADADTLFLTNWQNASYNIFKKFPKAGVVGLTPQFKMFHSAHSANVLFDTIFSKHLYFESVKNPEALQHFYKSIGWDDNYNKNLLKQALAIHCEEESALVGAGHYVATYKGGLFNSLPVFLNAKIGRNTEQYLDTLPLKFGLWRLTTSENYAYHIGNVSEKWMETKVNELNFPDRFTSQDFTFNNPKKISYFKFFIKNKLFYKILKIPFFYHKFLKYKGLPVALVKNYNLQ